MYYIRHSVLVKDHVYGYTVIIKPRTEVQDFSDQFVCDWKKTENKSLEKITDQRDTTTTTVQIQTNMTSNKNQEWSREIGFPETLNVRENQGAIKNGLYRESDIIVYIKHRTTTNKTNKKHDKLKR
jgi:hypothetical protein